MSRKDSIYQKLMVEGRTDFAEYRAVEDRTGTEELLKAVMDYYERDKESIEEFTEYFKYHRAENIWNEFTSRLFSLEDFKEDKLVGLSILLMRDTKSIEAIKFGMLLTQLYILNNVSAAFKLIADLAVLDEFYELGIETLKSVRIFPVIRDSINRKRDYETR
ncbi:hypothetical protein SAMN00017477_0947 [Peptoniphilus asaccharolyticus DSM 20463]|uniref:Uncharacterized protein n=1 Tax=Peptoniphilus asaccharolyticus DSM 20463 TaxID=573058 RepID=A0A1W1V0G2_PEPAS|nr:hypothetical protein [Peptoniphilus asaccharolyticus]MBL7575442.1 hypothetical protein [Peptoniphilus asaccharolyticus]SMB86780.1 hypothetical protein SAMN00017477_0947 [Peptoniphilus asaccharolyticus DSM 20463]